MSPFDLEKALAGAKVVTRDGREVTQLTKFDVRGDFPLTGIIQNKRESFKLNGKYSDHIESHYDLFMAPQKQSIWVNVYEGDILVLGHSRNKSFDEAKLNIHEGFTYIKTIEITNDLETETKDLHWATVMIAVPFNGLKSYKIAFQSKDELHNFCIGGGEITSTTIES